MQPVLLLNDYSVSDDDNFFHFPSKHLGRIIHGLCFSLLNVSSI